MHVGALGDGIGDQTRNDLDVGGDGRIEREAGAAGEIGVVVDVTVQRSDEVRSVPTIERLAVDRAGIGLADDADAGPAGVAEHHHLSGVIRQQRAEQPIGGNRLSECLGVVAELTDLGGLLVDEAEHVADPADARTAEGRIVRPIADCTSEGRFVELHSVIADHEMKTDRVTSPHLEPVEGGKCVVDRGHRRNHGRRRRGPSEPFDAGADLEPVTTDRPQGVLEPHPRRIESLVEHLAGGHEPPIELTQRLVEWVESGTGLGSQPWVLQEAGHTRHTQQEAVGFAQGLGRAVEGVRITRIERRNRLAHDVQHLGGGWDRADRRPPDDRDDSAHLGSPVARRSRARVYGWLGGSPDHPISGMRPIARDRTARPRRSTSACTPVRPRTRWTPRPSPGSRARCQRPG